MRPASLHCACVVHMGFPLKKRTHKTFPTPHANDAGQRIFPVPEALGNLCMIPDGLIPHCPCSDPAMILQSSKVARKCGECQLMLLDIDRCLLLMLLPAPPHSTSTHTFESLRDTDNKYPPSLELALGSCQPARRCRPGAPRCRERSSLHASQHLHACPFHQLRLCLLAKATGHNTLPRPPRSQTLRAPQSTNDSADHSTRPHRVPPLPVAVPKCFSPASPRLHSSPAQHTEEYALRHLPCLRDLARVLAVRDNRSAPHSPSLSPTAPSDGFQTGTEHASPVQPLVFGSFSPCRLLMAEPEHCCHPGAPRCRERSSLHASQYHQAQRHRVLVLRSIRPRAPNNSAE